MSLIVNVSMSSSLINPAFCRRTSLVLNFSFCLLFLLEVHKGMNQPTQQNSTFHQQRHWYLLLPYQQYSLVMNILFLYYIISLLYKAYELVQKLADCLSKVCPFIEGGLSIIQGMNTGNQCFSILSEG